MWVISDDIYEDLYYGPGPLPHILGADPGLKDQVAVVSGVSKTYAMTGWRIGFALANTEWIGIAGRIQAHTTSNPCSVPSTPPCRLSRRCGADRIRCQRLQRDGPICDLLRVKASSSSDRRGLLCVSKGIDRRSHGLTPVLP